LRSSLFKTKCTNESNETGTKGDHSLFVSIDEPLRKEGTMSTFNMNKMTAAMFPAEGTAVENVKFFPGHSRSVTAAQLAEQFDRANVQLRSGTASRSTALDGHLTVTAL
jgi:hypothetical protein